MAELTASPTSPSNHDAGESAQFEESHRTKPLLRLTYACNERCPFCNVPFEDYEVRTPPLTSLEAELDTFIARGEQTLTISGGEPTLYRDRLISLVHRARQGGIRFIELQSNATLIDDEYAAELARAGVTSGFISLLSHQPHHHDELAGLEGAFELCLRGIDALASAGVPVTLNPVIAYQTQTLVVDYIRFVAQRLPTVRAISLSAVQPHGRASHSTQLLPDYQVLKGVIPDALVESSKHDIELLNPYCGLPICIGWQSDLDHCVEAFEARRGGFDTPGMSNRNNKSQGDVCRRCTWRTRCGGAWHAYWNVRQGSGIAPVSRYYTPWRPAPAASDSPSPDTIKAPVELTGSVWDALENTTTAISWLWCTQLDPSHAKKLLYSRCTDLAIEMTPRELLQDRNTLKALRKLQRFSEQLDPQQRLAVWIGMKLSTRREIEALEQACQLANALGVTGIRLLPLGPLRSAPALQLLESKWQALDIRRLDPFLSLITTDPDTREEE